MRSFHANCSEFLTQFYMIGDGRAENNNEVGPQLNRRLNEILLHKKNKGRYSNAFYYPLSVYFSGQRSI